MLKHLNQKTKQMSTKGKTGDALNKAKAIEETVNKYAETLKANAATFRSVPGFSAYEISAKGVLRSRKTGKVQQIPTGKSKYYITNDKGERRSIGLDEIKALLPPPVKAQDEKTKKAPKERKASESKEEITSERLDQIRNKPAVREIFNDGGKKHVLCFKLHEAGFSTAEIMALTDTPYGATKRNIWYYTSGLKKLDA